MNDEDHLQECDAPSLPRSKSVTFDETEQGDGNVMITQGGGKLTVGDLEEFSGSRQTALRRQSSADRGDFIRKTSLVDSDEYSELKISACDFELLKVIGKGAYGRVLQVRETRTDQIYAMKVLQKGQVLQKNNVQYVQEERNILSKADHPFVVHLMCAFQTNDKLYLVMEYVCGGELFQHLRNEGLFDEAQTQFYSGEMILAIEYLHQNGIIHRDLKPENVLLDQDGHIRITDFGLAKFVTEDQNRSSKTLCGTDLYMAPEMIGGNGYGRAVDFWSLGIIIFEMLSGNPPFYARDTKKLYRMILTSKPKFPRWISPNCISLLKGLLNRNVEQRLGAAKSTMFEVKGVKELKDHLFYKGLNWEKLYNRELEPPFKPELVNGLEDTSHFSETFTNLNPCDMDEEDEKRYQKHLERETSDDFAGFSFTHESYVKKAMEKQREQRKKIIEAAAAENDSKAFQDQQDAGNPSTPSSPSQPAALDSYFSVHSVNTSGATSSNDVQNRQQDPKSNLRSALHHQMEQPAQEKFDEKEEEQHASDEHENDDGDEEGEGEEVHESWEVLVETNIDVIASKLNPGAKEWVPPWGN